VVYYNMRILLSSSLPLRRVLMLDSSLSGSEMSLNSWACAQALLYSEFHRNLQNGNCVYEGFVTSSLQFALLWNLIPIYRVLCGVHGGAVG